MDSSRRNANEESRCLSGLKNLKVTSKEDAATEQAQISVPSRPTAQKPRPVGAIESFVVDKTQAPRQDYSFYERSNVIASSKFATPKRVETIASVNNRDCAPPVTNSPTHSVDSLSQRSLSYQTEDLYEIPAIPSNQFVPPVYENVDYYPDQNRNPQPPPFFHQPLYPQGQPLLSSEGYYDTRYSKAQPQVPVSSRVKLTNPAVYENMICSDYTKKYDHRPQESNDQRFLQHCSVPGPQVPNTLQTRGTVQQSLNDKVPPPPPPYHLKENMGSDYTIMKSAPPKYTDVNVLKNRDNVTPVLIKPANGPNTAIYASIAPSAQRPKANIATEVITAAAPKFYHAKSNTTISKDKSVAVNGNYGSKSIALNRMHIVDDTNASDYVCMTGGSAVGSNKDNISLASDSIPSRNLVSPAQSPAPSPTPSSVSQISGGSRGSGGRGKSLLPFSITPPRPAGPSEAQRKIEELTRQLEEEMEKQDEEGEYFGK